MTTEQRKNYEPDNKLRSNCLNFVELVAQNIALISPTMTAALIVPLMFGTIGGMSWLPYAVGTVMLLFVAFNLNQFARRSAGTGSMYSYTSLGLGPSAGCMSGWCLLWAYLFIGLAGTTGFTIFAGKLLAALGYTCPPVHLVRGLYRGVLHAGLHGHQGIHDCEPWAGVRLRRVDSVLCFIVLFHKHFAVDTTQFSLTGFSWMNLGLGVVVAVFSLVGFESSTAFGEEAKDATKTIPKSIIWSLILTGAFFVFVSYIEVMATNGYSTTLDKMDAPLSVMCDMYKVSFLSLPICAGAMVELLRPGALLYECGIASDARDGPAWDIPLGYEQDPLQTRDAAHGARDHGRLHVLVVTVCKCLQAGSAG